MSSRTLLRASAAALLCAALAPACHRNPAPAISAVPPQVVVVLDEEFEPVASFHSRVGGACHGVTGIASRSEGTLTVAAKGAGKVVEVPVGRVQ